MSHESKHPLKNEVDTPAINAVYLILTVTIVLIVISIIGLRSYESMIAAKNREARELAPTTELNDLRDSNKAKLVIIDKLLVEQGKTK